MINESILDLQILLFYLFGMIVFYGIYTQTQVLKHYLYAYPFNPLGYFFYYLRAYDPIFRLIGNLFFLLGTILLIIGSSKEYNDFKRQKTRLINNYPLFFLNFASAILIGVQLILLILVLVSCFYLLRIFLELKTPRHLALVLFQGSGALTLFSAIIDNFNIIGAWELSYLLAILYGVFYIIIPLAAYTENYIIKSRVKLEESEKEFQVLFNNSISGIAYHEMIYDNNGNPVDYIITDVNREYEKILSLKREQVIKRKATEVYQVENAPYLNVYSKVANTQESISFETFYPPMESHYKISVISPEKGVFITVFDDISDRKEAEESLKSEKDKLQALMDGLTSSGIGIDIVSKNYEVLYQNELLKERFGGLGTQRCYKKYMGLEKPCDLCPMVKTIENNSLERIELIGSDGRFYQLISAPFPNPDGTLDKVAEIVLDMTEQKIAEKELKESEEKYRTISDYSMLGISIIQDMKIKYVNQQMAKYLGYTREELLNMGPEEFLNLVHPDDREYAKKITIINQQGETETPEHSELRMIKKNGDTICLDMYARSIIYDGGSAGMNVSIDITERKKAEQRLEESEEKFRNIAEQNLMGIVILQDNVLKYMNKAMADMYGYTIEEGLNWGPLEYLKLFTAESIEFINEYSLKAQMGVLGQSNQYILQGIKKSGELIWVDNINRMINFKGRPADLIVQIDITERKEAERLVIEENKKLQELNEMRQELITRISHELKTPITSIHGATQALMEIHKNDMSSKIIEFIEIIKRGGIRLKSLVENLLDVSRLESKKIALNLKNEDLVSIIKEHVNDLRYFAQVRNVNIFLDLPKELYFSFDKLRIGQVITNLFSNAINNTLSGGHVDITIEKSDDHVDIIIKDTGIGITESEKERLFEKFGKIERFGKGYDVYIEGSGLGLYISREFVKLHRGQILVESEGRDKGATFTVRLYLDKAQESLLNQSVIE